MRDVVRRPAHRMYVRWRACKELLSSHYSLIFSVHRTFKLTRSNICERNDVCMDKRRLSGHRVRRVAFGNSAARRTRSRATSRVKYSATRAANAADVSLVRLLPLHSYGCSRCRQRPIRSMAALASPAPGLNDAHAKFTHIHANQGFAHDRLRSPDDLRHHRQNAP